MIIQGQTYQDVDKGLAAFAGAEGFNDTEITVENCTFINCRAAADFRGWDKVVIKSCSVTPGPLTDVKWGRGFGIGLDSPADGNGLIEMEDVTVNDLGPPSSNYGLYNRDCVSLEEHNGPLKAKRCKFLGATDGCIDGKSDYTLVNCELGPSLYQLRVWPGVTARRAGLKFRPNPGFDQMQIQNDGRLEWLDLAADSDPFFDSERAELEEALVYYLLDTAHADYAEILDDCEMRHKLRWRENELSINLKSDGSQALVKSDAMRHGWRSGRWAAGVGGAVLDVFPASDHGRAESLLASSW